VRKTEANTNSKQVVKGVGPLTANPCPLKIMSLYFVNGQKEKKKKKKKKTFRDAWRDTPAINLNNIFPIEDIDLNFS
jgi:hypothetical protein